MNKDIQIIDCTLRDGGYYTQWDFDDAVLDAYFSSMERLPVTYLEIGYRNNPAPGYMGRFGYTPIPVLEKIRSRTSRKLAVMLNQKSTSVSDLEVLARPLAGLLDMIRLAVDPANFDKAVELAAAVRDMGFEVGFNMMYMSRWNSYDGLMRKLHRLNGIADGFFMVDSYGGMTPEEVAATSRSVLDELSCPVGFHGHNNLQMALANSLAAVKTGVSRVDATVLGMGRGAGNLNLELLLTFLSGTCGLNVDFNELGSVVSAFSPLMEKYRWGTSLPYMISGTYSFPQKEVMDWVANRVYSFNSIVRALKNRIDHKVDNAKYPLLALRGRYDRVIVVGGGDSVPRHIDALVQFIRKNAGTAVVLTTARHAALFNGIEADIFYCLDGSEGKRLTRNVGEKNFHGRCILPPYPRVMGTEVPEYAQKHTFELEKIDVVDSCRNSVTAIALQLASELSDGDIFIVGYDGYPGNVLSEKEVTLTNENNTIFMEYAARTGHKLVSLTPTIYRSLAAMSIYQMI